MENKGKLILTEIFPSVQKHDIFFVLEITILYGEVTRAWSIMILEILETILGC